MLYASNVGIKIHYEIEGTGPILVLQHGFMGLSLRAIATVSHIATGEQRNDKIASSLSGVGGNNRSCLSTDVFRFG